MSRRSERGNAHQDPRALHESLQRLAEDLGLTDPGVLVSLRRHWPEVVGASIAGHAVPSSLRDGVLVVTVDAAPWATEMRYLADDVTRGLSARGIPVTELRVRVGRPGD